VTEPGLQADSYDLAPDKAGLSGAGRAARPQLAQRRVNVDAVSGTLPARAGLR